MMKEEKMEDAQSSKKAENNSNSTVSEEGSVMEETQEELEERIEETDSSEESEVEILSKELAEAKDRHLRLYSEFENFRRRTAKERLELISNANEDLIVALLPVIDDFERAQSIGEGDEEFSAQQKGINLIYQKLLKELTQKGLKPMNNLIGKNFDAEVHEAISQIPAPKKKLKNCIVDVVEKGYYLNDKVIRYAKVVIGT